MIAIALRIGCGLTPTAWITIAALVFLIFGGYCAHRGAEGVGDRQAAESQGRAQGLQRAGNGRTTDTIIVKAREKELSGAVSSLPDAVSIRR